MTVARKITVELSAQAIEEIDAKVASGVYEDAEAFVMESVESNLIGMQHSRYDGSDPEIETWLREQVIPTYERWKRDKTPGIPAEEVFDRLKARRAGRKAAS
jgi:antitoxin ParD1/3/4